MFSIVIPYYNKSAYIVRCIDSIMNQTFPDYEVILVDDGSTDKGIELISKKYGDLIRVFRQDNQGVSAARNLGIEKAKYNYIAFLDADDAWHAQYLESVKWVITNEKEVKIVGSHYSRDISFLENKHNIPNYFKFENYFKKAIRNTYFTSSSSVIEKSFFDKNERFNINLKNGEDHDLWFRVLLSGGNSFYITNTLVYYSDEDTNQTTQKKIDLEYTLVGQINSIYKDVIKSSQNKDFNKFISLYVYFNLFPYYFDSKNYTKAKYVLKENKFGFTLLKLVYMIPFRFGKRMVDSPKGSRLIRLYFKFTIKYIYY
jgi:glycosyltransferase involved in cell wall biosynthesis